MRLTILCLFVYAAGIHAQTVVSAGNDTTITKSDSLIAAMPSKIDDCITRVVFLECQLYKGGNRCFQSTYCADTATVVEILKHPLIEIKSCTPIDFTIKSFEFVMLNQKEQMVVEFNKGAGFNRKIIQIIKKKIRSGDKICIENIKVITPGGTRTLGQSIVLTIQ